MSHGMGAEDDVTCLGMPELMSWRMRRQLMHVLAMFGTMGMPHSQHSLRPHQRGATIARMEFN